MGSIITATCDCGYRENEMLLGWRANKIPLLYKECFFPCYCDKCRTMFTGNICNEKVLCPMCCNERTLAYDNKTLSIPGKNIVFEWNTEKAVGRNLILTDGKYRCPVCGRMSMQFRDIGCWD